MTNLYETLGVTQKATKEEIETAYKNLVKYYPENEDEMDPSMKIFFDDIKLAYNTLYNDESRKEFDNYLEQNQAVAGY